MMSWLRADGLASSALSASVRSFATAQSLNGLGVLDIGCGTMPYQSIFVERGAKYFGADIDGSADILIASDGSLPLPDESVDIVVSFQVLEHVKNVQAYLATAHRVLRKGGRMFLSTHGVWPYHAHPTDYWRWTCDGLRVELEDAGFEIHKISALCGPAAWIPMFPMLVGKRVLGPLWFLLSPVNLCVNLAAWGLDKVSPRSIREYNAAIFAVELSKKP